MKTRMLPADHPESLDVAVRALEDGDLVVFPTDTVYGLGALAFNPDAIQKLYLVKGREAEKAIPVLLGSYEQLPQITREINEQALRLAEHFWPGPLTLVVPRRPDLPANLSPLPTIGVRMPDHPLALALLRRAGPLAVTSANLSGEANAGSAQEALAQLAGRIPLILDGGQTPGNIPSTVVDCTGDELRILRQGPISLEELTRALGG